MLMVTLTAYPTAPILLITNSPALILLTFSSLLLLLASPVGIIGTLLNSRPILAVYVLLFFPHSFPSSPSAISPTIRRTYLLMQRLAKRGTSGTLLAHGRCGKVLFVAVVGVVHFTAQLRRARVITRSPLPGCHGPLVRFDATRSPLPPGRYFLWCHSTWQTFSLASSARTI